MPIVPKQTPIARAKKLRSTAIPLRTKKLFIRRCVSNIRKIQPLAKADSPRFEFPATKPIRRAITHELRDFRKCNKPITKAITGQRWARAARLNPNVPRNPGTNNPSKPAKESNGIQRNIFLFLFGKSQIKTTRIVQKQSSCVNKKKRPKFQ